MRRTFGKGLVLKAVLGGSAMVATLAIAAAPASAAACDPTLFDGEGFEWDLDFAVPSGGAVDDGAEDAFDGYGFLQVGSGPYVPANNIACNTDLGGRQILYPAVSGPQFDGLTVSRRVYVPASGTAFARLVDILTNGTKKPIKVPVAYSGDLGSDDDTARLGSSSGDLFAGPGDAWVATSDRPLGVVPDGDNPVGHVIDSTHPTRYKAEGLVVGGGGSDVLFAHYATGVAVAAGETKLFMHLVSQHPATVAGQNAALARAALLAAAPEEVYAGLSDTERGQLLNFPISATDFGESLTLDGKKKTKSTKKLVATASCPIADCTISAKATIKFPGAAIAKSVKLKTKKAKASLERGETTKLSLKLKRADASKLKRAVAKQSKKTKATVKATAKFDGVPTAKETLKVKFKS